jgi:hypothetical protein
VDCLVLGAAEGMKKPERLGASAWLVGAVITASIALLCGALLLFHYPNKQCSHLSWPISYSRC